MGPTDVFNAWQKIGAHALNLIESPLGKEVLRLIPGAGLAYETYKWWQLKGKQAGTHKVEADHADNLKHEENHKVEADHVDNLKSGSSGPGQAGARERPRDRGAGPGARMAARPRLGSKL